MSKVILKAENISKQYRLGTVGTGTLSHDLNRWWSQLRGKGDPYAKVGAVNDRSQKATEEYVWAIKDINFEVKSGEVLGIIGKNGAGKSTLLKILSRVTGPTTGSIKTRGRIASLLEVGTGFHPELTGRENVFLNGAILGMTKAEVTDKLDVIIEFSGCEMYIDTPVKRYSSGMRVRLAFAVAAHLEPEILVIDEVLAVGDAEFQKKAIGKMKDISQGEGRTVIFVSHNMAAVKSLCTRGLVLTNGASVFEGTAEESVDFYLSQNSSVGNIRNWSVDNAIGANGIKVLEFNVLNENKESIFFIDSKLYFKCIIENEILNESIDITIRVKNSDEIVVFTDWIQIFKNSDSKKSKIDIGFMLEEKFLNSGSYSVDLIFGKNKKYLIFKETDIIDFEIEFGKDVKDTKRHPGVNYKELKWDVKIMDEELNMLT
ncbi:ABC transporter ATP-binding protein [Mesonia ostreae]|uniref:ABC transporter ATP-binding protein n=1 Tax=Mesonia ostreae TaxID=861110 RepID=A0ABU2KM53_9FLAO|nr:ABC transporter ATP-binding protein [Mesonia ostreae]MDT0295752.1 ABC transporter ATP-binding protein [Mesonia ostreae]